MSMRVIFAGLLFLSATSNSTSAVEYLRVCTQMGAGWFSVPGTDSCINVATGQLSEPIPGRARVSLEQQVTNAESVSQRAIESVAVALAMPKASVDPGKTFGTALSIGVYEGKAAVGLGAAVLLDQTLNLNAAAAYGLEFGTTAASIGIAVKW